MENNRLDIKRKWKCRGCDKVTISSGGKQVRGGFGWCSQCWPKYQAYLNDSNAGVCTTDLYPDTTPIAPAKVSENLRLNAGLEMATRAEVFEEEMSHRPDKDLEEDEEGILDGLTELD